MAIKDRSACSLCDLLCVLEQARGRAVCCQELRCVLPDTGADGLSGVRRLTSRGQLRPWHEFHNRRLAVYERLKTEANCGCDAKLGNSEQARLAVVLS